MAAESNHNTLVEVGLGAGLRGETLLGDSSNIIILNEFHWFEEVKLVIMMVLFLFLSAVCLFLAIRWCRHVILWLDNSKCQWWLFSQHLPTSLAITHLEEEHFEELRSREDEEIAQLEAQQASLRYLLDTAPTIISEPPSKPSCPGYVYVGIWLCCALLLYRHVYSMEQEDSKFYQQ